MTPEEVKEAEVCEFLEQIKEILSISENCDLDVESIEELRCHIETIRKIKHAVVMYKFSDIMYE